MTNPRSGRRYMAALRELKSRGEQQPCWSCRKTLYAAAPKGHPQSITLGHYTALEDGGSLLDPNNYGPQCMKCNYTDGANRTNRKRKGDSRSTVYRNPAY